MVEGAQSCFTSLAADRESAARQRATFGPLLDYRPHRTFTPVLPHRPKTRVGVFPGHPSGRLSRRGRRRPIITPGSRGCAYKTASGRHEWPSRDPIQEGGGINVYAFLGNNPTILVDSYGMAPQSQGPFFYVALFDGHYDTQAAITFHSGYSQNGKNRCPNCKNVKLAQIVSTIQESLGDAIIHSRKWRLDTDSSHTPWYPYQDSPAPGVVSMHDDPGMKGFGIPGLWPDPGQQLYGFTQFFETCAVCLDKEPHVIGCVSWGQQVAGLRHAWSWGAGEHLLPLTPSANFTRLTGFK